MPKAMATRSAMRAIERDSDVERLEKQNRALAEQLRYAEQRALAAEQHAKAADDILGEFGRLQTKYDEDLAWKGAFELLAQTLVKEIFGNDASIEFMALGDRGEEARLMMANITAQGTEEELQPKLQQLVVRTADERDGRIFDYAFQLVANQ